MPVPVFTTGEVLTAANMNAVGLWRVTGCTVTSAGGTAATASNGVITVGTSNTSVTVNNAFSADFDCYRIVLTGTSMSSGGNGLRFTLGATAPTANWYGGGFYINVGGGTLTPTALNNTGFVVIGSTTSNYSFSNAFDVLHPFAAKRTYIPQVLSYAETGFVGQSSAFHNADTSYSAFTIYPAAGSITGGTIRVYGYRN